MSDVNSCWLQLTSFWRRRLKAAGGDGRGGSERLVMFMMDMVGKAMVMVVVEVESKLVNVNYNVEGYGGTQVRGRKNQDTKFCGNWDIKTKIPQQCQVCCIQIPPYFMEWINLKDIYLNFYNRRVGMKTMLNELNIPLLGSHHLGIDDTKNISRVVQRMLADGALLQITARRSAGHVEFLFTNREYQLDYKQLWPSALQSLRALEIQFLNHGYFKSV
ncbi:hypothetical protein RDABS01_032766 [Bienertia sinuspersici]